ncbi:MAG: TIGR02147 family protein [Fibrobacterota bacterium]|nr:TIGR02147 family protein [Fibrobacterota bacterium]QQS05399.1 MAG: TIGR02147 family protein [Fibrobacterota bacterium]
MPALIGHLDYREWLRKFYEERKAQDSFFSYRFLAEKVGMDHSLLIKVLQGERHLSDNSIEGWIAYLKLLQRDADYFRTLVRFCKTRSSRERTQALDYLLSFQRTNATSLEADQRDYFRDWKPVALRGLIGLEGGLDAAQAGARLDPPISPEETQSILAMLERLGLLKRESDGRWAISSDFVEAGPEIPTQVIRDHQKQMFQLAAESIDRHPPQHRQVSSATISLALSDLPEVRERIRALRDSLLRLASESREADQIFQFQVAFFPLTQLAAGKRKRRLQA